MSPDSRALSPADGGVPRELGPYIIRRRAGQGAQATVYLAVHGALQRPAALKVLAPSFAADPEFVERFHREARIAARLQHRNVVAVYDSGTEAGCHWLAMEYIDGPSVADLIKREGPLPEARALEIVRDVTVALGCAGEHGILHRDVKPANILLARDGTTKLADLGLAKDRNTSMHQTATGLAMGTPLYMSPEQILGKRDLDVRSDIYSLGVSLFEMLTGRVPLRDETSMGTMLRHTNEDVPPPSSIDRRIGRFADMLVLAMTARERERRHPVASALVDDIECVLAHRTPPYAARATTMMERERLADSGADTVIARAAASGPISAPRGRPTAPFRRRQLAPIVAGVALAAIPVVAAVAAAVGMRLARHERPSPAAREAVAAPAPSRDDTAAAPPPERRDEDRRVAGLRGPPSAYAADAAVEERVAPRTGELIPGELLTRVARELAEHAERGRWHEGMVLYRSLGIGDDMDRLARSLADLPPLDGVELFRWSIMDRSLVAEGSQEALDRMRFAAGAAYGDRWPPELVAELGALLEAANDDLIVLALDSEILTGREALAEAPATRLGQCVGSRGLDCLRALLDARAVLPAAVAGQDADGTPIDREAVARRLGDAIARARELLGALGEELGAKVERRLARLERRHRDLARSGLLRLDGTDLADASGLRMHGRGWGITREGLTHVRTRGRRGRGPDREAAEELDQLAEGRSFLEIEALERFGAIELEVIGGNGPFVGIVPSLGGAPGPGVIVEVDGARRASERIAAELLERATNTPAARRVMTVRLEVTSIGLRLSIDGRSQPDDLLAGPTDRVRLHIPPLTGIWETRLHLR